MALCGNCKNKVYMCAFTTSKCKICGKSFNSSYIPGESVCYKCASANNLCHQCGEPLSGKPSKAKNYLDIAKAISERGTCLRRNYAAIIVKNDEIISTGYTGAPRGRKNCTDIGHCKRQELNIPSGERYELCRSVHAEQNAIISAARKDMLGSIMYLYGYDKESNLEIPNPQPCSLCERMIINAGIDKIITLNEIIDVKNLMDECD